MVLKGMFISYPGNPWLFTFIIQVPERQSLSGQYGRLTQMTVMKRLLALTQGRLHMFVQVSQETELARYIQQAYLENGLEKAVP